MIGIDEFLAIFTAELEEEVREESSFKDLDRWSSLTSLVIISEIEASTGVILTADDIRKAETIRNLYERLTENTKPGE